MESFEEALARTEADADVALKAANATVKAIAKLRGAARVGALKDLTRAIEAVDQAVAALRQQIANTRDGWRFDARAHLASGDYAAELRSAAEREGVAIYEHDQRLYCYPSLIEPLADDLALRIDKVREARLRPSVLVRALKARQTQPPRFKPDVFLNTLYQAYRRLDPQDTPAGKVVPLVEIHALLTLMPDSRAAYPRQDFARDIYLLSRHPDTQTREGHCVTLPASTGTKGAASRILTVIKENGQREDFYGIAFHPS